MGSCHYAEAPHDATTILDAEHDRYEWLALGEALRRVAPDRVRHDLARVIALLEELRQPDQRWARRADGAMTYAA